MVVGGPGGWLVAAIVAALAAAGVLLIDDDTAQLVFVVGLAAVLVIGGSLLERRRASQALGGPASAESSALRPDGTVLVPIVLAFAVSRLFDSEDARLAALFVLAVLFAFVWQLIRARVRPRHR